MAGESFGDSLFGRRWKALQLITSLTKWITRPFFLKETFEFDVVCNFCLLGNHFIDIDYIKFK